MIEVASRCEEASRFGSSLELHSFLWLAEGDWLQKDARLRGSLWKK